MAPLIFILILLLLIILIPILRVMIAIMGMRSRIKRAWKNTGQKHRPEKEETPKQKEKIFDRSMGEYVEFEEIEAEDAVSTPDAHTEFKSTPVSQQIVDAEWEDIK